MRYPYFTTTRNILTIKRNAVKPSINFLSNKRFQSAGGQTNKKRFLIFKKYAVNTILGLLIPYTGYALFVIVVSSDEISLRKDMLKIIERDFESYEGTLVKYSPLEVLGRYENPFDEYRIQTVYEFFFNRVIELFQRNRGGIPITKDGMDELMPIHKPHWIQNPNNKMYKDDQQLIQEVKVIEKFSNLNSNNNSSNINSIPIYNTWLGQSCNFIYYNGLKMITDPLFSDHLLSDKIGPKRITDQPCDIDQMINPDIIMVSHNHPDHLDFNSINKWKGKDILWIVPKGMSSFLRRHNVCNIIELSWWETCELKKNGEVYHISSVPAMHWSGRGVHDVNTSLWCSFLLSHNNNPIMFHAGDSGYVKDLYRRIKQRFGPGCKLALLPCGQYCPEWHQRPRHINPKEVIKIMEELEVKNVLGIHWGTFVLSGEYFREPKEKLEMLAEWKGIKDNCYCPELGKTEKII